MKNTIFISLLCVFICSCTEIEPKPFEPSSAHIDKEIPQTSAEIPEIVVDEPVLPPPTASPALEKYTVVVNDVPVRELLFALARDAEINVDIAQDIEGSVTLNAVEQTLPQILERISRQVDMRYEFHDQNLLVSPDKPYLRKYVIDYVNMSRNTEIDNVVSTQIRSTSGGNEVGGQNAGGGQAAGNGGNNSTTNVSSNSVHHFWRTLTLNVLAILGNEQATNNAEDTVIPVTTDVIPNPESGLLLVRANSAQHREIQEFIDDTLSSVKRQVLIRVTIAEVQLSDQYQAGVDWSFLAEAGKAGFDLISTTLSGVPLGTVSSFVIDYEDPNTGRDRLDATVRLLDEFGDVRVMSSPQTMVLNNQTALLKVVENIVYFEVDVEPAPASLAGGGQPAVDTTALTVPVGIVMSVTPQISRDDQISLNVRPTISRVTEFVDDPNPELRRVTVTAPLTNSIPQIEVREIESMLRLTNGQIAVLGGLMQDTTTEADRGLPLVSDLPGIGNAFKTTNEDYRKTELVIFIQPIIVRDPSIDGDLDIYQNYLDAQNGMQALPQTGSTGGS